MNMTKFYASTAVVAEKVKENWEDLEHYARSRRDVVFYMDNRAVLKCQEYERQLRHDLERQKW